MALKSALEAALERHKMSLSKVDNLRADKLNDAIVRLRENLREDEKILYKKLEERYGEIAKDEDDNFNVSMALNMLKDERKIVRAYTREYKSLQRDEQTLQELIEPPKKIMPGRGGASSTTAYYASMWRLAPNGMRFDAPPNAAGTTEHFESTPSTHIAKYDENGGWYNTANLPVTSEQASELKRADRAADLLRRVAIRNFRDGEGRRLIPYDRFEIKARDYAESHDIELDDAKTILREDALRRGREFVKSKRAHQQYLRNYYNLSGANNPLRSDRERELFDKTVEFGGGSEGRAMADEYITRERNDKAESLRRRRRLDAAKREQKANEAYRYDMMDEFDQKMHDLTERYGGGTEGRRMARQKIQEDRNEKAADIRKERRSRDRRAQNIGQRNFNYDMMDEFDQKMHDLTERYGGDASKADASLRNMLKKELGPFFKNSKMSTRDLHGLYKNINKIGQISIVGRLAKSAMLNPYAAAATLGIMFANSRLSVAKEVNDWRNTESVFGRPDSDLARQMKNAGIGDEGSILKKYSTIASWLTDLLTNGEAWNVIGDVMVASMGGVDLTGVNPYTSVEDLAKIIAPQFARLDKQSKIRTLKALSRIGVDENVIKSWEFYSGVSTPDSSYQSVGGTQEIIDKAKRITNKNPLNLHAWLLQFKPIAYLEHLLTSGIDTSNGIVFGELEAFAKSIGLPTFDVNTQAENIAEQDLSYQQSRAANPSYYDYVTNNNGGSPVSIHIDTAEFNGIENLDGLKNEVSAEANTVKERHTTAEAYDPKMR